LLDPEVTDREAMGALLQPAAAEWFVMHAAPRTVNSPKNDAPALIEPDPEIAARRIAELERPGT